MAENSTDDLSPHQERVYMTADIVSSYVSNNPVPAKGIPEIIHAVFSALSALEGGAATVSQTNQKPAIPISKSITPDAIICLEDGKKLKMLKRHLRTAYGMTPAEYRTKWRLPADYPMVAPNYAKQRSQFAKKIGLGRKPGTGAKKGK